MARPARNKTATLKTERKSLSSLKPHPSNPRIHPEKGSTDWEKLSRSLELDYFDPIVWNKANGMLVSGHLRVKILMDLGYSQADVVVVDYDEPTHLARLMAANEVSGSTDEERQRSLLSDLIGMEGFDMAFTGLDESTFADMGVDLGGGALFEEATPFVDLPDAPQAAETVHSPAVPPEIPANLYAPDSVEIPVSSAPEPVSAVPEASPPVVPAVPSPAPSGEAIRLAFSAPEVEEFNRLTAALRKCGEGRSPSNATLVLEALRLLHEHWTGETHRP